MELNKLDLARNKGTANITNYNYYDKFELKALRQELRKRERYIIYLSKTLREKNKVTKMLEAIYTSIMHDDMKIEEENSKDQLSLFGQFFNEVNRHK